MRAVSILEDKQSAVHCGAFVGNWSSGNSCFSEQIVING